MAKVVIRYTPRKGYVFVTTDGSGTPPTVKLPDGTTLTAVKADRVGGVYANTESGHTEYQWAFPGLDKYNGAEATFSFGGGTQTIPLNPSTEYRIESQGVGGLDPAPNKALGGGGFPGPAGLTPGQYGAGYLPAYLGGQFPMFQPITYNPINAPNYQQFNPAEYAQKYGPVIRSEMLKNFQLAEGLAYGTLANELKGLKAYAPAAAALAREQAAVDNVQNQAQRTAQLDRAIPGVRENLAAQTERAGVYASGRLPSEFDDRQLELGVRSRAADSSAARGFGASSLAGKTLSDTMSAEKRFEIAKYGDSLVDQNAQVRTAVEVAPTEYINSGQQIQISPRVGAGEYLSKYLSEANQLSQIPGTVALQSSIGQSQFKAGQDLQVSTFNATNQLNTDMYNASNLYTSQLGKFNYDAGYAQNAADNKTAEVNQAREDAQRAELTKQFKKGLQEGQTANTIKSIIGSLGLAPKLVDAISSLINTFGGGNSVDLGDGSLSYKDWFESSNPEYTSTFDPSFDPNTYDIGDSIPDQFGPQYGVDLNQFYKDLGYYNELRY